MTSDWATVALGDAGTWVSGGTPSTSNPDYWGGDIPWMSAKSMTEFRVRTSDRRLTQLGAQNGTKLVPKDVVLMVVRGMSLKTEFRMGITQREVALSQDLKGLIPDPQLDPLFLAYALQSKTPDVLAMVDEAGHGTGRLQTDRLFALELPKPGLDEQRAIASTLGALDDKIESNRRALRLLDDLSRSVFQEWRSMAPFERLMSFGEYSDVYGGATPRTSVPEYWDGDLAWTTPTDVTALPSPYLFGTGRTITEQGLASCSASLHPAGTIFMTSRATIGAFAINQVPAATNQGFIAVRPRSSADRWFLFEEMRSRVPEFLDNATGSTFMELSRGRFKELPLAVPGREAVDELASRLDPLHAKAAQLANESTQLGRVRDVLLPELMSGRIRVPLEVAA